MIPPSKVDAIGFLATGAPKLFFVSLASCAPLMAAAKYLWSLLKSDVIMQ